MNKGVDKLISNRETYTMNIQVGRKRRLVANKHGYHMHYKKGLDRWEHEQSYMTFGSFVLNELEYIVRNTDVSDLEDLLKAFIATVDMFKYPLKGKQEANWAKVDQYSQASQALKNILEKNAATEKEK